jgi:hypothetical protein
MYEMRNTTLGFNVSNIKQERAVSAVVSSSNFLKQSPKIHSGKYRQVAGNNEEKLFSLLDIPIQKTARSLKMPIQYERPQSVCLKEDNNTFNKVTERNIKTAIGRSLPVNQVYMNYPPHALNTRLSKTSHSNRENSKTSSAREIKQTMDKSDIFFLNKNESRKENFAMKHDNFNQRNQTKNSNSDIFMLKNDNDNLNKCGEKYLFKTINNVYDTSTRSNSEWKDKNIYDNLLNHSSRTYHMLNPDIKNISKTKQDIMNEATSYNPIYRQKSLCEFIDLNRVGVPNPNKAYLNAAKTSKNPFARNTNICAAYNDIYGGYRNLCDKPFDKNIK